MKLTMSRLCYRLMLKAELSGNYQAMMLRTDFGDGRAVEITHPLAPHQNPGGMQHAILINPVDLQNGIIKYAIYDRHINEPHPNFGVDDKQVLQVSQPEDLDKFIDDVWNHLLGAPTQTLRWDL